MRRPAPDWWLLLLLLLQLAFEFLPFTAIDLVNDLTVAGAKFSNAAGDGNDGADVDSLASGGGNAV